MPLSNEEKLGSGKVTQAVSVLKPWGYEKIWAMNEKYVGKILKINPGHRLSRQYHEVKDETIHVLSGMLLLLHGAHEVEHVLAPGSCFRIKPGTIHRFCAPEGGEPVVLLEASTPELEDVVRLDDDYGR